MRPSRGFFLDFRNPTALIRVFLPPEESYATSYGSGVRLFCQFVRMSTGAERRRSRS